jgi:hypothetical protein
MYYCTPCNRLLLHGVQYNHVVHNSEQHVTNNPPIKWQGSSSGCYVISEHDVTNNPPMKWQGSS